jgi:hypothetical protein
VTVKTDVSQHTPHKPDYIRLAIMKFNLIAALSVLPTIMLVNGDWDLWTGTCAVGGAGDDAWTESSVGTYSQWACGGWDILDNWDYGIEFTTVNPCNTGETIIYKPNGNNFNIYVQGQEDASQQIGHCFPGDLKSASCQYGLAACLCNRYVSCQSTHCN